MIIEDKIFGRRRVIQDKWQYTIQRRERIKNTTTGEMETKWVAETFHNDLGGALSRILKLKLSDRKATITLKEYIEEYTSLQKQLLQCTF